jgi:hypothetical protein
VTPLQALAADPFLPAREAWARIDRELLAAVGVDLDHDDPQVINQALANLGSEVLDTIAGGVL